MAGHVVTFIGGATGPWQVVKMDAVVGPTLEQVTRLAISEGNLAALPSEGGWLLRGVTSNERYVTRKEKEALIARQPDLGRPEATCAALVPIGKSASWWNLMQDERRRIFETQSHHIKTGIKYLPAVARRLYHCRDLGEPFDFLTWFEYAPADAAAFEQLVAALRKSEEWRYVEREIDIRLVHDDTASR